MLGIQPKETFFSQPQRAEKRETRTIVRSKRELVDGLSQRHAQHLCLQREAERTDTAKLSLATLAPPLHCETKKGRNRALTLFLPRGSPIFRRSSHVLLGCGHHCKHDIQIKSWDDFFSHQKLSRFFIRHRSISLGNSYELQNFSSDKENWIRIVCQKGVVKRSVEQLS